ncbi:hypothetical protein BgiBS90_026856, partial [Biomphalaria glabrata]
MASVVLVTFLTLELLHLASGINSCKPPAGSELWNPKPEGVVINVMWDIFADE